MVDLFPFTLLALSAGFDFEFSPVLLVFENQAIHQCASISIVDDFLEEDSEYVNFCLRTDNPQTVFGLHSSATVVIEDNDSELYLQDF